MDDSHVHAELTCSACERTCSHELVYAGRLLVSTRCTACDHVQRHDASTLRADYLHDIEQRLRTKPGRIVRRIARAPVTTLRDLPMATIRKPARMAREVMQLLRRE